MSLCASTLLRLSKGYAPLGLMQRVTKGPQFNHVRLLSTTPSMKKISSEESFILRHQAASDKSANRDWFLLRAASVGMLTSIAGCFILPGNAVVDFVTVTLLAHHTYVGISHIIGDYVPLFTKPWFAQMVKQFWFVFALISLGLMYNFNYNGAGFSNALVGFFKL